MAKLTFSSRPPFTEQFAPDLSEYKGLILTIRSDARSVGEGAWKKAKGKKTKGGVNELSYLNWKTVNAITGWSGFTLRMLEALGVPPGSIKVEGETDSTPDTQFEFDRTGLEWLAQFCPPFMSHAATAVRQAYGEEDEDEDEDAEEDADRK